MDSICENTGSKRGAGMLSRLVVGLMLLQLVAGCGTASGPTPTATAPEPTATVEAVKVEQDYWPTDGWKVSTPEEQGIDSAALLGALERVEEDGINLRSMTVIRNGYVVMEAYRQPFTKDMRVQVHSVTKSVIGALTGIAIDEGLIKSVDDKVLSYFPNAKPMNMGEFKASITIRDLITMQPGLDCGDDVLNWGMENSTDWVKYVLDLPMKGASGKELVYCTAGVHLMSAVLTQATGVSTKAYAREKLFDPIGIDMADVVWPSDPQGVTLGGYGIEIKLLDVAKLGLLYLNNGMWDGKQVVPKDWVEASRRAHAIGSNDKNYGYLWWVYPSHYAMEGYGEQKVMVVQDKGLVVVMTAAIDWHKGQPLEDLLRDQLIPAAKSDVRLPENPDANKKLQAKIADWANPVRPVAKLNETAMRISGKTYTIKDTSIGWSEIRLDFGVGSSVVTGTVQTQNGPLEALIGLDGVYRITGPMDGNWIGLKGEWVNENTFVGREIQASPDVQEEVITFVFEGDEVRIHAEEVVMATFNADVVGVMKK